MDADFFGGLCDQTSARLNAYDVPPPCFVVFRQLVALCDEDRSERAQRRSGAWMNDASAFLAETIGLSHGHRYSLPGSTSRLFVYLDDVQMSWVRVLCTHPGIQHSSFCGANLSSWGARPSPSIWQCNGGAMGL